MARTVVVTGGGTGIGRATAAAFAAGGDRVLITGRRATTLDEAVAALGERVTGVVCDSTDPGQLVKLRGRINGPVDVLVNNAGGNIELDKGPAADLQAVAERWRTNFENNLLSAVLTTTVLEDDLAPGGAVVHIGSFAADRGNGSYGAAKAGLASWNIHIAHRLGPRDVTSNVVSPGYIVDTGFFRECITQAFHDARVAETMTRRCGRPGDIAGVVHFLASPAARHITGQVIPVNGGALTTR